MPRSLPFILTAILVQPHLVHGQQPLREFPGCDDQIRSVAFSPDGTRIAAGGCFQDVRIWDTATGKQLHRLNGRAGWALAVAFAPDGKTLASTNWKDGTLSLWDLNTAKERLTLSKHVKSPEVHHVAYAPNGKLVGSVGYDGTVRLWDPATGKELQTLAGQTVAFYVVAFSPDSKRVASGASDGRVRLWEAATGKALHVSSQAAAMVTAVVFAGDGKKLYYGSDDGAMREWEVETGKELRHWSTGHGAARTLALSPDGRSLAVATSEGLAQVWELATLKQRRQFRADDGFNWTVTFAPDGKGIATGGDAKVVRLWDITDGWGKDDPKRPPLTDKDLDRCWRDLSGADAALAYTAVWALSAQPAQSVPFLARGLPADKARPVDTRRIATLIGQLVDDDFAMRAKASEELELLGAGARAQLVKALEKPASLEQKARIEQLLKTLSPEEKRLIRATEVLERIGSADAKRVLEEMRK